jgi:hypothetical protein
LEVAEVVERAGSGQREHPQTVMQMKKMSVAEALSVLGAESAGNLPRLDRKYQELRESLVVADNVVALRRLDDAFEVLKTQRWELEHLASIAAEKQAIAAEKQTRANLVDAYGQTGWPAIWSVVDAGEWLEMGWSFEDANRWASAGWGPLQVTSWAAVDPDAEADKESTLSQVKLKAALPTHSGIDWAEADHLI